MVRSIKKVCEHLSNQTEWCIEPERLSGVTVDRFRQREIISQALREIEAIHQQEIAKARIEELERIHDHYNPYRPILDSDTQRSVRRFVSSRIAELSQTLKEHEEG